MKYKLFVLAFSALVILAAKNPQYQIGDAVSDFSLKNVDGKNVRLSDYNDQKGVIVVFDCNTCPVSKQYNERILALNRKFKPLGFPLVAINANDPGISPGDSFPEMVQHAKKKNYDFPYLFDETQNVAKAFGATNTPHVFILKREGKEFKLAYIGAIDNNGRDANAASQRYVEDAVNALLEDKPVPKEKTKAIGCGIKYRNS